MSIDINKYRLTLAQTDKILRKTTDIKVPKGYKVIDARRNKKKNDGLKK